MAKKIDSKNKPAAPAKRAVKPAAVKTKTVTAKEPVAPIKEPVAEPVIAKAKPAAKAPKSTKPKAPAAPDAPAYSRDDIALRAYFIAEKRRAHGQHGDEHQDWIEAERQLASEIKKPRKLSKA